MSIPLDASAPWRDSYQARGRDHRFAGAQSMSNLPDNVRDHADNPASPLFVPSARERRQRSCETALECLGLIQREEALDLISRLSALSDALPTAASYGKRLSEALDRAAEDIRTEIPEPSEIAHFAETHAALLCE